MQQEVPFLLVHGLASNSRLWDGCAEALAARGHLVAAVDLRGHGESSKPDSGYDTGTVVADLATLIEALGFTRPAVVGQSWGGNLAVQLAASHPELVSWIGLVDGGTIELQERFPEWTEAVEVLSPPVFQGVTRAQLLARMRAMHPDWPHAGIEGALANFEELPDGTIRPHLTLDRHLAILRGLWEHRPSTLWAQLTVPVLFVTAANDAVAAWTHDKELAVQRAEQLLGDTPHRSVWFRPADHDLHAQFPDRLAELLDAATNEEFFR